MIYPYTIIKAKDINIVCKTLKSFGYYSNINIEIDLRQCNSNLLYVVINDCGEFGNFCFYEEGKMSRFIYRIFIEDLHEFLEAAAIYKGCTEY